jgi:hypothetical protein
MVITSYFVKIIAIIVCLGGLVIMCSSQDSWIQTQLGLIDFLRMEVPQEGLMGSKSEDFQVC